jgi:adenosylmethionine-8-amino-7-oxononanoate aminotransferase
VPETISNAIQQQLHSVPFVYGGLAMSEIRARLASLVAHLLPGDLGSGICFPSSGSEANEAAISLARRYSGKFKVINFYRSYHGGTQNSKAATGDFRRWMGGDTVPGFVKAWSPYPLFWDYAGDTESERTAMALSMLEEQILNEGPNTIALIQFESIIGSGGVVIPPPGYMEGVRALCDKYDILLHFDEVMAGFGRTGKLFGFQHFDGIIPDIVTAAKGLTASYVPLSMMACRKHVMEAFEGKSIGWGSTYQAHPVALACSYETLKYMVKEDVIGHVHKLEPVMGDCMQSLAEKHPCIKQYRQIGLFGCFDVHDKHGENPQLQHEPPHDALLAYKKVRDLT